MRTSIQLTVAATLLGLLAILGTLQYRWVGEVSAAERERLRNSLRTRANDATRAFDREITRTFMAFRADPQLLQTAAAAALSDALARSQRESEIGGLVADVYYVEGAGTAVHALQRLDPVSRTLTTVEWPPEFAAWRKRLDGLSTVAPGLPPLFMGDAIDPKTPALVVSIPTVKRIATADHMAIVSDPTGTIRTVILRLDRQKIRHDLIATVVERQFGKAADSDAVVAVLTRDDAPELVYASETGATVTPADAVVTTGMFDLRMDELYRVNLPAPHVEGGSAAKPKEPTDRLAITIVRRGGADAARILMSGNEMGGAWQVLVRYKDGSLEALVARSRTRNLAIGLGVLSLLAASFVFVIGSARRQQRLARQQMEFVAAVSHELRTPLAVIRSAGENLADGVVGGGEPVQKYGTLISTEGRRLSDMVERVMEFAGISSGAPVRTRMGVDVRTLVAEAARSAELDARERGVTIVTHATRDVPLLEADEAALRSAVQNVIANAVKYSPDGAAVHVEVSGDAGRVRITIADSGLGIDGGDLPHIFKPFYRGRRAVDAQIRGTGVGLSVVRHVVDAHGGEVRVESRVGQGTTVVMTLPAASDRAALVRDAPQARPVT